MNARAKTSSLLLVGRRVRPIIIPGYVQLRSVSGHLHSDLLLTPKEVRGYEQLRLMVLSESERHFKPCSRSLTKAAQLEMVG